MSRHDNNQLARDGEHWALDELKRQGHDAQLYGGTYSFDILIANRARIEVKTSFLGKTDNYSQRWQFSFNRYGRFCADLLLCICAPDTENLHIIAVTRRGIDFCCGGDWQSPQWLLLKPDCTIEVVVNDLDQVVGYGCGEPDLSRWIGEDGRWKIA
jgi:hypothetical protein